MGKTCKAGYVDKRSRHAIAVDRGINAQRKYSDFNNDYKSAPNETDVVGYDTKGCLTAPKGAIVKPKKKLGKEKKFSDSEIATLKKRFHEQGIYDQFVDLQSTRKVVRTKKQLENWKKNPNSQDVRGIDTAPKGMMRGRIELTQNYVGGTPIRETGRLRRARGNYAFRPRDKEDVGVISVRKNLPQDQKLFTTAHELGHAYDRNVVGIKQGYSSRFSFTAGNVIFNGARSEVKTVTESKLNPYNPNLASTRFVNYRNRSEELFANWFGGFLTKRETVKKESPKFYESFVKEQPHFFGKLQQSDYKHAKPYMKVPKGFKFKAPTI